MARDALQMGVRTGGDHQDAVLAELVPGGQQMRVAQGLVPRGDRVAQDVPASLSGGEPVGQVLGGRAPVQGVDRSGAQAPQQQERGGAPAREAGPVSTRTRSLRSCSSRSWKLLPSSANTLSRRVSVPVGTSPEVCVALPTIRWFTVTPPWKVPPLMPWLTPPNCPPLI